VALPLIGKWKLLQEQNGKYLFPVKAMSQGFFRARYSWKVSGTSSTDHGHFYDKLFAKIGACMPNAHLPKP